MNFGAMQTQVQVLLGDENESVVTKANIRVWLNQAYTEISQKVGGLFQSITVNTISADKTYTFPTTLLGIERILWAGEPLWPNSWQQIRNYRMPTGTPYSYYVKGSNQVGFYPEPLTNTGLSITFDYRYVPADLVNDADVVLLPDLASDAMINHALVKAYMLLGQVELMTAAKVTYEEQLNHLMSQVGSFQDSLTYPIIGYTETGSQDLESGWQF